MTSIDFQVLTWHGRDVESRESGVLKYMVDAYGRTAEGRTVCAHVSFTPYFFVSVRGASPVSVSRLTARLKDRLGDAMQHMVVTRKRFYSFTDGAPEQFLLLRFTSQRAMRKAAVITSEAGFELFESNVPPELRLLHVRELPSVGWVRCSNVQPLSARPCTICDKEFECSYQDLSPLHEITHNAPMVVASFDIECVSEEGGFPNALAPGCPIIQIATTFWRITEDQPYRRHLACLGASLPLEGVDVDTCQTEQQLLVAFAQALRREQVDILLGYNIWGFDFPYIYNRAALKGALGPRYQPGIMGQTPNRRGPPIRDFPYLMGGKRLDHLSEINVRTLESSAYGQNQFSTPSTPGVLQIDLLVVLRKEFKLSCYKLNAVSEHFLGDHKVDLPIKEMFALYKQGTSAALQSIAEYCVKDTELPIKLMRKLGILPNMMEMAKAVHVPMDYLIFRGQQIKVFSVILKKTKQQGYLCPTKPLVKKSDKYTGATVLEAKVGAHFGHIACLDFASLYPSIIRAHNMCHSTVVLDDNKYGQLPHIEYEEHILDGGETVKFAVTYTDGRGPVPSILPALLTELAEYRQQARTQQKLAQQRGDTFLAELYNGKQLAYKVTMNSLYGFCGAANGILPCVPIAAAITCVGRQMIARTKEMVESLYNGAKVVYGDSVTGYTPVLIRHQGMVLVETIESLDKYGAQWIPCLEQGHQDKEACELPTGAVEAWTDAGWTPVLRIVRHQLTDHKRIIRVNTHSGVADVTDDHSLLLVDGTKVSPNQLQVGDKMLHAPFPELPSSCNVHSAAEAQIMGYSSTGKAVPASILNAPRSVREGFWMGLCDADGDKDGVVTRIDQKSQLSMATINLLASSLGYYSSLSTREDKPNVFRLDLTQSYQRKCPDAVEKMYPISYDGFVYDLTTTNHHFQVGVGRLIGHNTDSVMCDFKVNDMAEAFRLGEDAANRITQVFKRPIELEFEKVMSPLLLYSKKRYASLKFTSPAEAGTVDAKGISLVRRDSCELVRQVYRQVLDSILINKNMLEAKATLHEAARLLLAGNVSIDDLVMSKALRGDYKSGVLQPHDVVRKKMAQRNPGEEPRVGDRVPFIYTESDQGLKQSITLRAEDPQHVKDTGMLVDFQHYLSLLKCALSDTVEVMQPELDGVFDNIGEDEYNAARRRRDVHNSNVRTGQAEITRFFAPQPDPFTEDLECQTTFEQSMQLIPAPPLLLL